MTTTNDALEFIKQNHNGEIPYTFGKNEYSRWMAEFANDLLTKQKLNLSGIGSKRHFSPEQVVEVVNQFEHSTRPINKRLTHKEFELWAQNFKAACASGGEAKGVSVDCYCKQLTGYEGECDCSNGMPEPDCA